MCVPRADISRVGLIAWVWGPSQWNFAQNAYPYSLTNKPRELEALEPGGPSPRPTSVMLFRHKRPGTLPKRLMSLGRDNQASASTSDISELRTQGRANQASASTSDISELRTQKLESAETFVYTEGDTTEIVWHPRGSLFPDKPVSRGGGNSSYRKRNLSNVGNPEWIEEITAQVSREDLRGYRERTSKLADGAGVTRGSASWR